MEENIEVPRNEIADLKVNNALLIKQLNSVNVSSLHYETASRPESNTPFITDKIRSIGAKRINYKKDTIYNDCKFAVNNNGYVLVLSRDTRASDTPLYRGEFLLYNPSGNLQSRIRSDHLNYNDEIQITDNMILHLSISDQTIRLTSFDFEFHKLNFYELLFLQSTRNIYKLDYVNHRIYLKQQIYLNDNVDDDKYVYETHMFDRRLKRIYAYYVKSPKDIDAICIRNDYIVHYSHIAADTHEFQIKSRMTRVHLKQFVLQIPWVISMELGPNDELYLLNIKESYLEEYTLFGCLIRKVDVSIMANLKNPKLCVSDNYHFLIGASQDDEGILYLNQSTEALFYFS